MTRSGSRAPKSLAPTAADSSTPQAVLQRRLRALVWTPAPPRPSEPPTPAATPDVPLVPVVRLGDYLCAHGLIAAPDLAAALGEQRHRLAQGRPIALGDLLVEQGHLTTQELVTVLMLQQLDRRQGASTEAAPPVGELLVQAGLITTEQLAAALTTQTEARQRGETLRLGQILIAAGVLSRQDLATTLVQQRRARR
jgi:hypothetical protein